MLKNITIGLLTFLLLPIGAACSAIITGLMLACLAITSPFIILGGALKGGGFVANKCLHRLFPFLLDSKSSDVIATIASALLPLLFSLVALVPSAVVILTAAAVIAPLFFVALIFVIPFLIAEKSVNKMVFLLRKSDSEHEMGESYTLLNGEFSDGGPRQPIQEGPEQTKYNNEESYASAALRFFNNWRQTSDEPVNQHSRAPSLSGRNSDNDD